MMRMLIDAHEPETLRKQLVDAFVGATVAELGDSCGDLWIELETGIMIVERKTPDDLTASIADGRLFRQSEHIPRLCRFPFLVVDGELRYSDDGFLFGVRGRLGYVKTGWRKDSIEAALIKAQMHGMILVRDCENYILQLGHLIAMCERADVAHVNRYKARNQNPFEDATQAKIDFLAQLPGVGTERAAKLVEAMDGGVMELIAWIANRNGREVDASKIALWGPVTHEKVREFLGLRPSQRIRIDSRSEWQEEV